MTLTPTTVAEHLTQAAQAYYRITVEDTLPSTNTALKALAANGACAGTVLIARHQTGGRGRLGRSFHSPTGTGLYMSVLVRPNLSVRDALSLTTATAAVCADAFDALRTPTLPPAKIKWVNDIYCPTQNGDAKKVCGILCESALIPGSEALDYAVIGIGVNLLPPPGGFPADIAHVAGALFEEADQACELSRLTAEILNRLLPAAEAPCSPVFADAYRARSLLDGQRILVRPASSLGGTETPATAVCVESDLGLRVRYGDGTEAVLYSGEVEKIRLS